MSKKETEAVYYSTRELTQRWRCSPSSVARIATRAGLHRYFFGTGKNGMVRYLRKEVEAYETSRRVKACT